jgi:hypothetical protein
MRLYGTTEELAEKGRVGERIGVKCTAGAEARIHFAAFAARVNSRPDTGPLWEDFFSKL